MDNTCERDIMKALIRHTGETVIETDNIEGIDWTTGAPLTNARKAQGDGE